MSTKYVAYYRVSTKKQGQKGLSLSAQKRQVIFYIESLKKQNPSIELIGEFQDVKSGKNGQREGLSKAIELARKNNAILITASQDRLSRDFELIKRLANEKRNPLKFMSLDNLKGSEDYVSTCILGLVAEVEYHIIKQRNEKTIAFRRKRGDFDGENRFKILQNLAGKDGNLEEKMLEGRRKGLETRQKNVNERYEGLMFTIVGILKSYEYITLKQIAQKLTALGYKTLTGKPVDISLVRRVLQKMKAQNNTLIVHNNTKENGTVKMQAQENLESLVMKQYKANVTYSSIAKWLNNHGVTTKNGGKFYSETIKRIVKDYLNKHKTNEKASFTNQKTKELQTQEIE